MIPSQVKARNLGKMFAVFGVAVMGAYLVAPTDASALCMAYRPPSPAYQAARQAMNEGKYTEGMRLFREAARYPGQATAWISGAFVNLGMRAGAAGQPDKAREHFRAALREQPTHTYAAYHLAESFLKSGRPHDALGFLNTLPKQLDGHHLIVSTKVKALQAVGDHAAAKALQEKPKPTLKVLPAGGDVQSH